MPFYRRRSTRGRFASRKSTPFRRRRTISGRRRRSSYRRYSPRLFRQVGKTVFPPYFRAKLFYSSLADHTIAWPVQDNVITWRANDLYDPESAVGGGQPRYFDTLCGATDTSAPYARFIVTGCKFEVIGTCLSSAPIYVGIGFRTLGNATPATFQELTERPDYKGVTTSSLNSGQTNFRLSMYRPINKLFGLSRKGYIEDTESFAGDYANSPVQQALVDLRVFNAYPTGAGNCTYTYRVKITYYCKFFGLNDVHDS